MAAELLDDQVVPFFDTCDVPLSRVLTENPSYDRDHY
jgi:hypothetical protein